MTDQATRLSSCRRFWPTGQSCLLLCALIAASISGVDTFSQTPNLKPASSSRSASAGATLLPPTNSVHSGLRRLPPTQTQLTNVIPLSDQSATKPSVSTGPIQGQTYISKPAESTNAQGAHESRTSPALTPDQAETQRRIRELEQAPKPKEFPTHTPFWQKVLGQKVLASPQARPLSLEQLAVDTLRYSLDIKVLADQTRIDRTSVVAADAQFDWTAFAESSWADLTEPTGSTLTTGGAFQSQSHALEYEGGLRQKNIFGGEVTASSRLGFESNNSTFFQPPRQGQSRLTLNYSQPLLRGAGQFYNQSTIVLAQLNSDVSQKAVLTRLQDRLVEVHNGYWQLFSARANLTSQRKLSEQADQLIKQLELRQDLDGARNQWLRAQATASVRKAALLRAQQSVVDAQASLRQMINAPSLGGFSAVEYIPQDVPMLEYMPADREAAMQTALRNRPEVLSAMHEIQSASVRLQVSKNELLPALNLVIDSYLDGLRGDYNIGGAFRDQFEIGRPSYSVGLEFEAPFGRREARANLRRSSLELRQMQNRFQLAVERVWIDVDTAVRDLEVSYREIQANHLAMQKSAEELNYLEKRWQLLPPTGRTASLILEDLLNTQSRLVDAELAYLGSRVAYVNAIIALRRATGTLTQCAQF